MPSTNSCIILEIYLSSTPEKITGICHLEFLLECSKRSIYRNSPLFITKISFLFNKNYTKKSKYIPNIVKRVNFIIKVI